MSVPLILLGSLGTKQRTAVTTQTRESFFSAVKNVVTNIHFLRVTAIYALLLFVFGAFGAMQTYLGVYGLGVASIFTILPALHADVVDFDEFKTGRRREGMLGAAATYLMKSSQAIGAGISGFLITWAGFDVANGGDQGDTTFLALRAIYAFGACVPLVPVILILLRYPLTEQEVNRVQAALRARREQPKGDEA